MAEEYEKKVRFAGVNVEVPAIVAKSKKRLARRAEQEKLAAALSKKKKAAKKAASAQATAIRTALSATEKTPK